MNGRTITLAVRQDDFIASVKQRIGQREGMPHPKDQRLSFEGKQLDNTRYLSDYNIQNESSLDLSSRLNGGLMEMLR